MSPETALGGWDWPKPSVEAQRLRHAVGRVPSRGGRDAEPPCVSGAEWQRHPAADMLGKRLESASTFTWPAWSSGILPLVVTQTEPRRLSRRSAG